MIDCIVLVEPLMIITSLQHIQNLIW